MNLKYFLAGGEPTEPVVPKRPRLYTVFKTWLFFRKPLNAGNFVMLETLTQRKDLLTICKIVIGGNSDKYTIFDSGYVMSTYYKKTEATKQNFKYIYNGEILTLKPPTVSKEPDWNKPLREQFTADYGQLMELVYLICGGDMLKEPIVSKMHFEDFLTKGQYLLRKRNIES
jgi:hypothetical protein